MRTIGFHWSRHPRGDYAAMCDVCGVQWRRSKLKRNRDGRLVCPDHGSGTESKRELDEGNARGVHPPRARRAGDGAGFDPGGT